MTDSKKRPLEVGDRVHVYMTGYKEPGMATIRLIKAGMLSLDFDDKELNSPYVWHPKQCRRLVKRPIPGDYLNGLKAALTAVKGIGCDPVDHYGCLTCKSVHVIRALIPKKGE